ncbi:Uncharacterised protein [Providencia rettgeri]|uniref:Uncharacterized protein n=2 Tax=Morganellaceae TaxID=1903414 RepID=A0A379FW38_PRORE|nr:Uncharacterised protein [Providencia rettgeri]
MVQSLPILGSVNNDNDLMTLINNFNAGYIHINGDDEALLNSAISLYEDKELRTKLGDNGFKLLKDEFDVKAIASSILEKLGI